MEVILLFKTASTTHEIAMDTCCLINFHFSGKAEQIISSLPSRPHITEEIVREVRTFDAMQYVNRGILILDTFDENEESTFVNLAALPLGNGESACGTLALHRGYAIATDDFRAVQEIKQIQSNVMIFSTPRILRHWEHTKHISPTELQAVLQNIETIGQYKPRPGNPELSWWHKAKG